MKRISKREAAEKYGVIVSGASGLCRFYLREDGCVVDDSGCVRYMPPFAEGENRE